MGSFEETLSLLLLNFYNARKLRQALSHRRAGCAGARLVARRRLPKNIVLGRMNSRKGRGSEAAHFNSLHRMVKDRRDASGNMCRLHIFYSGLHTADRTASCGAGRADQLRFCENIRRHGRGTKKNPIWKGNG